MLDGDPDAQPDRAGAGLRVGQEGVLDDQRSRRQVRVPQRHLLVGVQDAADRAVADGVAADAPPAADGVLHHLLEVVRLPERVPAEARVVGVRLAQEPALDPAVHTQLQAPDPEPAALARDAGPRRRARARAWTPPSGPLVLHDWPCRAGRADRDARCEMRDGSAPDAANP